MDFAWGTARHYEIMFLVPESNLEKVPDVIKKVEGTLGASLFFCNSLYIFQLEIIAVYS